jgi:hypothetical protein
MNISERDIFDYVFSQNELGIDKLDFINNNLVKYAKEIEICKSSLNAFYDETNIEPPKSIRESAVNFTGKKVIFLDKVLPEENNSNGIVRLAADSPKFEKKVSVDTFIDKKQEYVVKVISQEDSTNIYVFKNDNSPIENFSLELLPSHKILRYQNNSNPIQIEYQPSIENVELHVD